MAGLIAIFFMAMLVIGLLLTVTTVVINDFEKKMDDFGQVLRGRYESFRKSITLEDHLKRMNEKQKTQGSPQNK